MGTQLPRTERGTADPTFRPMSVAAKRSPISATAELLFHYLVGVVGTDFCAKSGRKKRLMIILRHSFFVVLQCNLI